MLIYLGRISYGLYVFHVLGLLISDHVVHDQTANLFRYSLRVGVALAATILMAADIVSLAGNAVPEPEAAVHARAFASGRIAANRPESLDFGVVRAGRNLTSGA